MPTDPALLRRHETLLAHREWVRTLARSLVARAEDADDVEQQTWVAALVHAPEDARSLRGWLTVVARNAARKLGRGDARRRRREDAAPPGAPVRSAADLAEQADAHARLVAAVVALDEPYREAILLRYFEGAAVGDAAARAGVPLETMRARLRRARALLRDRLAAAFGEERPWRLALAALAGPAPRGASASVPAAESAASGGASMLAKCLAVTAVVAAALAIWIAWPAASDAPALGDGAGNPLPQPARGAPRGDGATPPRRDAPRAQPPGAADGTSAPAAPAASAADASKRLDLPVDLPDLSGDTALESLGRLAEEAEVPILVAPEASEILARAGEAPALTLDAPLPLRTVLDLLTRLLGVAWGVEDARIVVLPPEGKRDASRPLVTPPRPAAGPALVVRGRVVDENGAPVAGAWIHRVPPAAEAFGRSDASGAYEARLRRPGTRIQAVADGRIPSPACEPDVAADRTGRMDLVVGGAAGAVRVTVTADGKPVAGADVALAADATPATAPPGARSAIRAPRTAPTGADGIAALAGVRPGTIAVTIGAPGYQWSVHRVVVTQGATAELAVSLTRRVPVATLLACRTSIAVADTSVTDLVAYVSRVSGASIVITPQAAERIGAATVTLELRSGTAEEVLRLALGSLGIGGLDLDLSDETVARIVVK